MIGVPGPRGSPELTPVIESTEFGRSLPRRVASATAARILARIQIWFAATGVFTSNGRHSGVLTNGTFVVDGQIDVLRTDGERLRRTRSVGLGVERGFHRGPHVGRQIG